MSKEPLVSCLTAHLPLAERFEPLKQSVALFAEQTHASTELIVAIDEGPNRQQAADYLNSLDAENIRVLIPEKKRNLGQLRNLLWEEAKGDFICCWDDDDLHGRERVERQLAFLIERKADAVYLQEHYHWFPEEEELWWLNWRATEWQCLQGTVFARRSLESRYPTEGEEAEGKGDAEDTVLLRRLCEQYTVDYLAGAPELYCYVYHANNLRDLEHHKMLASSLSISSGLIKRRTGKIRNDLQAFGIGRVVVRGPKGPGLSYDVALAESGEP